MTSACFVALLATGVFAQAPGELGRLPAPPALSRSWPISSAIAALRSLPSADQDVSRAGVNAAPAATAAIELGVASTAPEVVAVQGPDRVSDWSRVRALPRGSEITLTAQGSPAETVVLLIANDSDVFVIRAAGQDLPSRVKGALIRIGDQWPRILGGDETYSETKGVRVARDGIFEGTQKVAELARVVRRTRREDISEIRGPGRRKGNKLLAGIGAGGGQLFGLYHAIGLGWKPCGSSCSDEKLEMGLSVIALPIALGLLGYYGGSSVVGGMIYRPPPSAGDGPR